MAFQKYKYTDEDGLTHPIRLSDKVAAAQTTAASAGPPYDSQISADVQNTKREIGLAPRKLRLSRRAGTAPNVKVYTNTMPVCVPGDVAGYLSSGTVTIGGVAWQVDGVIPEDAR
jgi:hypothetical protein